MFRLVFLSGSKKGKRITIRDGMLIIGRGEHCHLRLPDDENVALEHVRVEHRSGGVYLSDMETRTGTTVNGRAVNDVRLNDRDVIKVGSVRLEFQTQQTHVTSARPFSLVHWAAYVLVGIVILLELVFIVGLSWWSEHTEVLALTAKAPLPAKEDAGQTETTRALEERLARSHKPPLDIKNTDELGESESALDPEAKALAEGVEEVIAQLKEDVTELRTKVDDLAEVEAGAGQELDKPAGGETVLAMVQTTEPEGVAGQPGAKKKEGSIWSQMVQPREEKEEPPDAEDIEKEQPGPEGEERETAEKEKEPVTTGETKSRLNPNTTKAQQLIKEALSQEAGDNLIEASATFERIHLLSPDYVPAYVKHARLAEKRGRLKESITLWGEVLKRSIGTPSYQEAAFERQRLAKEGSFVLSGDEVLAKIESPDNTTQAEGPGPPFSLPGRIKILSVERDKFPENEKFDEMRLVRVLLQPQLTTPNVNTDDLRIEVRFYDKGLSSGEIGETRALVPENALKVHGSWDATEKRTVTAAYIIPKGFRGDEKDELGEERSFYGYIVRVYYFDELQDEEARPPSLIEESTES